MDGAARAGGLDRLLADGRVGLLDGGLATQLERMGADLDDPLWSARLLLDDPSMIAAAHRAYLEAGAEVLITASYQASFEGLAGRGASRAEAEEVLRTSVALAREVRDAWVREHGPATAPLVAASVGPFGAMLADGSEYTGRYGVGRGRLVTFHARRLEVLADPATGADLLAVETIPSALEAEVLVDLLAGLDGPPAWLSLTCRDEAHLADGTPFADVVALAADSGAVVAIGVNCTAPRLVEPLVASAASAGRPVVAYPNRGDRWDPERRTWVGGGEPDLAALVPAWVAAGARLVGGCCGTGPDDVRAIGRVLAP
jgi:homocysteine S-methyltransferase